MKRKFGVSLVCVLVLGLIFSMMPVSAASTNFFPDDLFSSADVCGQYFEHAAEKGTIYEEVDGEHVMTMPFHSGFNYLYTSTPIPYDTYTISFDFYLIISPQSHFHEMDFLFGMSGNATPMHQATLTCESGSLMFRHYEVITTYSEYIEDALFYDVYDEECWQTFSAEITPEEVTLYLNGEYLVTLTDSAGCVGEKGCIGLRAGSKGGWKIKNLKLVEGLSAGNEEPTDEPTTAPTTAPTVDATEVPTQEPSADATEASTQEPSADATEKPAPTPSAEPTSNKDDGFPLFVVGIITAVILVAAIVLFVIVKKKK